LHHLAHAKSKIRAGGHGASAPRPFERALPNAPIVYVEAEAPKSRRRIENQCSSASLARFRLPIAAIILML
jgi:hypothetical protein